MADIFLSYSREDRAAIEPLAEQIAAAGYSVWWDKQLTGGKRYLEETEAELNAAKVVLVAWSNTSIASHWVADEAGAGRDTGRLLPISLDGSMPPLGFRQFQVIDFSKWTRDDGAAIKQLTSTLGKLTAPSGEASAAPKNKAAAPFGLPRNPAVLGLIAVAAVAILAIVAMNFMSPRQAAGDNRLTAFFGFTAVGDDPAVAAMSGTANSETYKTFAALGLETASEGSTSNVLLAQQLETAAKLKARYAVGGEVRKSASGFDISLRIDDAQRGKTLWRETISGSEKDTIVLPVAAAEQAGGTIRCLNRMFEDIPGPSEDLIAALARACAARRLRSEDKVQAWRAAEKLAPDSPAILAMVGSSLSELSSQVPPATIALLRREAVETLAHALKLEPGLRDAQANLAINESENIADLNRRLAKVAAASLGDVEPVEPALPDMLKALGLVGVGQFADSIPLLRQAARADALFYAPQGWLGMSLIENGQMREGRAIYERVITRAASFFFWSTWAMQEFSNPDGLAHVLDVRRPAFRRTRPIACAAWPPPSPINAPGPAHGPPDPCSPACAGLAPSCCCRPPPRWETSTRPLARRGSRRRRSLSPCT